MKLTKDEKQQMRADKKQRKKELKEERSYKKQRHQMAMGIVLHQDRTFTAKEIDVEKIKKNDQGIIEIEGFDYYLPDVPYDFNKWWPFKPRTLRRYLFPDPHSIIVWNENNWKAIDINWAYQNAEHTNIMPTTMGGLLKENGFAQSIASMKAKNKLQIDRKWIILIVIVVAVIAFLLIAGTGVKI